MQAFLIALLKCSVSMSVLAVILMALAPVLSKKYAAKWLYYAWFVIVDGLIIPFRLHFTIPIFQINAISTTVQQIISANGGNITYATNQIKTLNHGTTTITWIQIIGVLWFAGTVASLIYHGLRHTRFLRMVRRWVEQANDPQMLEMLESIKTDIGIVKPVKLLICPCVSSPMMIGFLNPAILLPRSDFSLDELPYIFRHELVHFKRKDLWYKSLVVLATAIHWFNPIVYLMARVIASQCEISCDAEVVNKTDMDGRQRYSEAIIRVIKTQSRVRTAFSTNFYGGKKDMKKRIFSIMDTKKKRAGISILCLVVLGTLGTGVAFANNDTVSGAYSTNTPVSAQEQERLNQQTKEATAKTYAVYKKYGLTYDKKTDSFHYDGKLVRYFSDKLDADDTYNSFTRTNGVVDLKAVRNNDYELTGITPVSQEEYDKHTESMKNAQTSNKQGAAQENSSVEKTGGASSAVENNGTGDIVNSSTTAFSEGDLNYIDTSLDAYLNYGVSYDNANKQWTFDNKTIHYLNDKDIATYLDNSENAIKNGVSLEVVRTANGQIDKLVNK